MLTHEELLKRTERSLPVVRRELRAALDVLREARRAYRRAKLRAFGARAKFEECENLRRVARGELRLADDGTYVDGGNDICPVCNGQRWVGAEGMESPCDQCIGTGVI